MGPTHDSSTWMADDLLKPLENFEVELYKQSSASDGVNCVQDEFVFRIC